MKFTIRYNPILYLIAAFICTFSGQRIRRIIIDPPSYNYSFFVVGYVALICGSIIALVLLSLRSHITLSKEKLTIREYLIKKPIEVQINQIREAVWGKQQCGFWTRGRKQFSLKLRNDQALHFYSLATLSKKKRDEFFQNLQDAGVEVKNEAVPNL